MARRRLLFLSQTLPYPPDGGVKIRTYNVLRLLAQTFDVTALCFVRSKAEGTRGTRALGIQALKKFCKVEAFSIPQEESFARLVWDHVRSVIRGNVYTTYVYDSEAFRTRLGELLRAEHFDIVHVDTLDLSAHLGQLAALPIVCTHHNIESSLLFQRANREQRTLRRLYLRYQAGLMEKEEKRWVEKVALNVVVSAQDKERLVKSIPAARVTVVPNGVDTELYQPRETRSDGGIVFVGGTTWFPNKDALSFFCAEILPLVRRSEGQVPVHWIGRATESEQREVERRAGVVLTGYVDDIRPYVHNARCYIVPLRVGGGTRLKILDAWAMGKAVVSTSIGCEGLAAEDGKNILIRNTPDSFAAAVVEVLRDDALRRRLSQGARRTAEGLYSWSVIGRTMGQLYSGLVEGPAEARVSALSGT